ncbi:MAG: hypothetical protein AUJ97_02575 [Bacteroidetes bacterium CG2_30_32_10]|nr:MAG: hypothetical protein AUJ97_02575 [Bacteroidetes bacterium CG2_30_32_10]
MLKSKKIFTKLCKSWLFYRIHIKKLTTKLQKNKYHGKLEKYKEKQPTLMSPFLNIRKEISAY